MTDLISNEDIKDLKNRPTVTMSRRDLISGLASGTVVAFVGGGVSGCETNEALGRQQFLLVSDTQLAALAEPTWKAALQEKPQMRDPSQRRRVSRIGDRIVQAVDSMYPSENVGNYNWEYAVIDDDTVNAWVMPGGKVAFHRGLLDIMDNDDQAATVMGHEVGHVIGKHSAERYSQQMGASIGMSVVNAALERGDVKYRNQIAGILGAGVTFGLILPYSRQHEYEADRLGTDFMAAARYRPNESVRFWDRMTQQSQQKPLEFMSTHPSDTSRIQALQNHIASRGYA